MHVGGFPGASRSFQGPPGASRGLQGAPGGSRASRAVGVALNEKCALPRTAKASNLKFHAGWSGWTRPPTMAGVGGVFKGEGLRLDASTNYIGPK